jgi:hypothetical protein
MKRPKKHHHVAHSEEIIIINGPTTFGYALEEHVSEAIILIISVDDDSILGIF